jgi:hypothetical protein
VRKEPQGSNAPERQWRLHCGIELPELRPSGIRSDSPLEEHEPLAIGLEPAPVEYGLHRAQYEALAHELEAAGFRVRLERRRAAHRRVGRMTFGTFYDLVIRLSTDSGANVDALIERIQHLLSSVELPPMPRMGKVMLGDGTEHAFPLDKADVP